MAKSKVRLRDIAIEAGVSVSTVSLVLNGKALQGNVRISTPTIREIERIAIKLGYLSRGTVGLVVPWIWPSVEIPMIQGITQVFKEAHYNLAIGVMTSRNLAIEIEELQGMDAKGFDSIIIQPSFELMSQPELLRNHFQNWERVVIVNQVTCPDVWYPHVTVDQKQCGYVATRHLLDQGHRNVACVSEFAPKDSDRILAARYEGYSDAMEEFALRPTMVIRDNESPLVVLKDITAAFCLRYQGAADLLGACLDEGIRVPDDLSIVGMADEREKTAVRPKLTTVDIRASEMGILAAQMILDLTEGKPVESSVLQPNLIIRDSTYSMHAELEEILD